MNKTISMVRMLPPAKSATPDQSLYVWLLSEGIANHDTQLKEVKR